MTDLYSVKDVARIFSVGESRLRYWAQTGFINPSVRRRGRVFYTFHDLIHVRAAKELLDSGLTMSKVRNNLTSLRAILPELTEPATAMRVYSDGETIAAQPRDITALPTAQLVMDFTIDSLTTMIADELAQPTTEHGKQVPAIAPIQPGRKPVNVLPAETDSKVLLERADQLAEELAQELASGVARDAIPDVLDDDLTEVTEAPVAPIAMLPAGAADRAADTDPDAPDRAAADPGAPFDPRDDRARDPDFEPITAYQAFVAGCEAEDRGDHIAAEAAYRRAIELQPSLAAAHTNLGNVIYRAGDAARARAAYERALDLEPNQPEARYNLANVLEDMGEMELAIAELRRVCWAHPELADAHYNLGLLLARVGGVAQAQKHLRRYLELDQQPEWCEHARAFLSALA